MFTSYPTAEHLELRTLLASGFLDTSFQGAGLFTDSSLTAALDIAAQRDGKIVAVGYQNDAAAINSDMLVTRYNRDGSLDSSFGQGGRVIIDFGRSAIARAVAIARNGDILIAGGISGATGIGADVAVARLNANGNLDNTFSLDGTLTTDLGTLATADTAIDIGTDSRGRIVVAARSVGDEEDAGTATGWSIVRYTEDGDLDRSFAQSGFLTEPAGTIHAIEVLPNGEILAAGQLGENCSAVNAANCSSLSAALVRYNQSGARDLSFGAGGIAQSSFDIVGQTQLGSSPTAAFTDIALQGNRIVAVGIVGSASRADLIIARFTRRGLLDGTFNPPSRILGDQRAPDPLSRNNRILGFNIFGSNTRVSFGRVTNLDTTFTSQTPINSTGNTTIPNLNRAQVEVQPDGRIVIGATSAPIAARASDFFLARLTRNGNLDDDFAIGGRTVTEGSNILLTLHSLALQPGTGRVIAAGRAFDISPGDPERGRLAIAALEAFDPRTDGGTDDAPPRAVVVERPDTRGRRSGFSIRYIDESGVDRSTLDNDDIVVTGPNGYSQQARLERVARRRDDLIATYSIPAPGGRWNRADNGRYTITLRDNQVSDTLGNSTPQTPLSRFRVNFP